MNEGTHYWKEVVMPYRDYLKILITVPGATVFSVLPKFTWNSFFFFLARTQFQLLEINELLQITEGQ